MPLYIRDNDVDALALRVQALAKTQTKTEAVRQALQHEIERLSATLPLRARLAKAFSMAEAMGITNQAAEPFDQKTFFDEMWGG